MILITGTHKSFALYKAVEEGVNHMWTVSAFQQHPHTLMICDEDATLELRVKTVKYFKVSNCFCFFCSCFDVILIKMFDAAGVECCPSQTYRTRYITRTLQDSALKGI